MQQTPAPDLCVPCGDGILNVRVGAIIVRDGKALMVKSKFGDYCYSVGGRIKFGETAEQAVLREVFEETGVRMTVDRLGFVSEVYFINDNPKGFGKPVYELAFYFYMSVPADFEPLTANDTAKMLRAFGGNTWNPKPVWVIFADGSSYMASTHSMPHGVQHRTDNNFAGHSCLHFPRTQEQVTAIGPYATNHQETIDKGWTATQSMK